MSAQNQYTDNYIKELNKFCYGEGMVPLLCITSIPGGQFGIFADSKFDHQQKVDIINTGMKVAVLECMAVPESFVLHKPAAEFETNEKKLNADTDDFLNELIKHCYAERLIPAVTILGNSAGTCKIFANKALLPERKAEIIMEGLKAIGIGVRKELAEMKKARHFNPDKDKIKPV
jgi:hypothetical protein